MESQAHEIKQIAAQLLAGMLANPNIDRVYPSENGRFNQEQQARLIETAVCLAESLAERTEKRIEEHLKHDFLWEGRKDEIST